MSMRDETLLLLYHCPKGASEKDLVSWVEHSNPSTYRRDVLRRLHDERMVEFKDAHVKISPKGARYAEDNLDLTI